jgi:hypothetical protein
MKPSLIFLALLVGQLANTLQDKPVVHLREHRNIIDAEFGGDLLELINAPTVVNLPSQAPKFDSHGKPWSIDVKNLGPGAVTVIGNSQFSIRINLGKTVHIYSNGEAYSLTYPLQR